MSAHLDASTPPSTHSPSLTSDTTPTAAPSTKSNTVAAASSKPNAATIAGSVIGGVVFLVLAALGILLYLRARKRKRTPPSSEFLNSIKAGATPVLRLDSGAAYTPALSEKAASYTPYPPTAPRPCTESSYHTGSPVLNMKFPDEITFDIPSRRPSVEKPLQPQRYSSQPQHHYPSSSVGSRRELWGSDTEVVSSELSPVRQSPVYRDPILQFAPHFSLDDPSPLPSLPSHSPPPLHPLRREPSEDT